MQILKNMKNLFQFSIYKEFTLWNSDKRTDMINQIEVKFLSGRVSYEYFFVISIP